MIVERITQPTAQPFDSRDLATHLRADTVDFAWEVTVHGRAAAAELEKYAQLALLDQTIRVTCDGWGRKACLDLPIGPVLDALSVVITVDGVAFDEFAVTTGLRPSLRLTGDRPCGLVVIEYLAGFGPAATDVPPDLALAILDQAAASFDQRGDNEGKSIGVSPHMARIAARYRRLAI
jgi:uncharacterized phiE125 gp8 family phage protein